MHLIHQADLQINGKTIESTQPFINVVKHFQMLSEAYDFVVAYNNKKNN